MKVPVIGHLENAPAIIEAIGRGQNLIPIGSPQLAVPRPGHSKARQYQLHLQAKFGEIIGKASFDYISKTNNSWLMIAAIAPDRKKVDEYETAIRELFPA